MSSESEPGPTLPDDRIVSLDALRGFALLGILPVNVWVFSMPEAVLANPTVYGDFTGWNYVAWLITHLFAEGKMITLFTLLFGAGVLLFTRNRERSGADALRLHYRRTGLLLAIGLAHAYLLWYGDILVVYALCALFVVGARHWKPIGQALVGLLLFAVPSVLELAMAVFADPAAMATQWNPSQAAIDAEIEAYLGSWTAQLDHRADAAFARQTAGFLIYSGWRISGVMLLGMALFQWGVLSNDRSPRLYRRLIAIGTAIGASLTLAGVWYITVSEWALEAALFYRQFNYWGSLFLAGAYVGVVMRYCRRRPNGPVTRSLGAVGRTAFSNYLFQTVAATSIFYGHGLGLFGQVSRVELLGVVAVIWAVQIAFSVLWLRYFRFGPVEWVWRVLTYGERQPIRS